MRQEIHSSQFILLWIGWTTTHWYFVLPFFRSIWPTTQVGDYNRLEKFNLPTKQEIQDRSTSNALPTAVALMQVTWFLVDYIVRAIQSVESTQSLSLTKLDIVIISYTTV
jgi:hypothetical protein